VQPGWPVHAEDSRRQPAAKVAEAAGQGLRAGAGAARTGRAAGTAGRTGDLARGGTAAAGVEVEVRRSARRRRTVSAYRDGHRIVVLVPQWFSRAEEARWVADMVADVQAREDRARRRGPRAGDAALQRRAQDLARSYLPAGVLPVTIRWVSTMLVRWASCTPADRTIRISDRLQSMPDWVVDYVIVHELAHVVVPGHGPKFWALVDRYPRTERARGYLEGLAAASDGSSGRRPDELC
jgi:predicted metal-dependent hydrolase